MYARLACLTLIGATATASQEVRALEDLNAPAYWDSATGEPLVPWGLRLLVTRLQSLGFGDGRRAISGYYELAREARGRIADAAGRSDLSVRELWRGRLADLGIRVAGALVEMDDLAGASAHLKTLKGQDGDRRLAMARALLWLHLGDVEVARLCVGAGSESPDKVVSALCDMADGEYGAALAKWEELDEELDDEMVGVNRAVCLLYMSRMEEVNRNALHLRLEC